MLDPNFSSAEMTAFLRSSYSDISKDYISQHMVSNDGIGNTYQFITLFNYPLIARLISVRARFFLNEAVSLLETGKYDACISIASGFSLLTSLIKRKIERRVAFIDCDLKEMIDERQNRINNHFLFQDISANNTSHLVLNIADLYQKRINITTQFSQFKNPLFLIEGLSYFLPKTITYWLMSQILQFENAAIIMDYCPTPNQEPNKCLQRLCANLPGFLCHGEAMLEQYKINEYLDKCHTAKCLDISEIEKELLTKKSDALLVDKDGFLPTKIVLGAI